MSFMSREDRYNMLCGIKRGTNPNLPKGPLTEEEETFIQEFAMDKLNEVLSDPEVIALLKRLKDR